ncbi:hypothetical protein [Aquimarina addita]
MKEKLFNFESLASFSFYYLALFPTVILIYITLLTIYFLSSYLIMLGVLGILIIFAFIYNKMLLKDVTIDMTSEEKIIIDFQKGKKYNFEINDLVAFYSYDTGGWVAKNAKIFLIFEFKEEKVRLFELGNGEHFEVDMMKEIISLLKHNYGFKITEKSKKYSNVLFKDWEIFKYERT